MSQEWWYATGDQKHGPITSEQLKTLARSGELMPSDLVWTEGMTDWRQASSVKGLMPPKESAPPPLKATTAVKLPTTTNTDQLTVLGRLQQHSEHQQYLCLECGYNGLMGVAGDATPWRGFKLTLLASFLAAIACVYLAINSPYLIKDHLWMWLCCFTLACVCCKAHIDAKPKRFLHCPNCDKTIGPIG